VAWPSPTPAGVAPRAARRLAEACRRNPPAAVSAFFLLAIGALAVAAPLLTRYTTEEIDLGRITEGPGREHWLGTDENGRDVLTRLLHGARVSLSVAFAAVAISVTLGSLLGAVAGYFGGPADHAISRLTDALLSIPTFFLLLTVLTLFGTTLLNIVLVIGLTSWMGVARLVRGEVLKYRVLEFVLAGRALGAEDRRIIFRHILPQTIPAITVASTLGVALAILVESSLSYLGLGVQPPTPSWGNMLSASQNYIWNAPQLAVYPGVLILLTVLAFNALGEGLRDLLDPQREREGTGEG
jgi:peptide/nickel transport system permease protein